MQQGLCAEATNSRTHSRAHSWTNSNTLSMLTMMLMLMMLMMMRKEQVPTFFWSDTAMVIPTVNYIEWSA